MCYVLHTLKRKSVALKVAEKVNIINKVTENLKNEIAKNFLIFSQTELKNKTDILHKYKINEETLQNMILNYKNGSIKKGQDLFTVL